MLLFYMVIFAGVGYSIQFCFLFNVQRSFILFVLVNYTHKNKIYTCIMSQNMSSTSSRVGGVPVPDSPLQIFQPFNAIVYFAFFSPVILASGVTSMSFVFQNFKGLIYLGFLIGVSVVRSYVYMMTGASPLVNDKTICTSVQYSKYGNPTFSAFVFAFTIGYLCIPMFHNDSVNFWIFISLICYFLLDMFIKMYKKCVVHMGDLFLNILMGLASSALIIALMYSGGSSKYLFFNEVSSDKEMCYQPSQQTFKCSLYSNGELVSEL